jgi:hypothetical protein
MPGKGTLESLAILGLVKTMSDQFVTQTHMTPALTEILSDIDRDIDAAFLLWPEQLTHRDILRINCKLVALSDMIPMDHETTITVFTSFIMATLEDCSKKLHPIKKTAIQRIISSVLCLHLYFMGQESDEYTDNTHGAKAADAWQEATII